MKKIIVFAAFIAMSSCTNEERTVETLEAQGFTNIETTGYSRGCADSDDTCTGFEATSISGKQVSGSVGCGRAMGCMRGKGCTIRMD